MKTTVIIHCLAFSTSLKESGVRAFEIEHDHNLTDEEAMEKVFTYTNHPYPEEAEPNVKETFTHGRTYSPSVGDVMNVGGVYYLVAPFGYKEITLEDFKDAKQESSSLEGRDFRLFWHDLAR